METFSQGWQMRIALARLLVEANDLVLLDEPTNYLDIEARTWLLGFLARHRGGLVLVAHDRYFLDSVVTRITEIGLGRLGNYPGTYSRYETQAGGRDRRPAQAGRPSRRRRSSGRSASSTGSVTRPAARGRSRAGFACSRRSSGSKCRRNPGGWPCAYRIPRVPGGFS